MRIFIGIDLDPEIRARILRFLEGIEGFAPDARWVRPESLHVTLKFIGEQTPEQVEAITARLERIESGGFEIRLGGYGFFPTAKAPRVFWIGIQAGPQLGQLAGSIDVAVAELGIAREDRPFSPHLTLARFPVPRQQPALVAAVAEWATASLGRIEVSEFFLFESKLAPQGAQYRKVLRFPRS